MTPFRLAWTHLWRKRLSTGIAVIGIAVSVATSGVLLRVFLLSKARFSSLARTGDAIVGAKGNDLGILLGCLNQEGDYPDFVPGALYQSLAARQALHFEDGAAVEESPIANVIPFAVFAKVQNFRVVGTTSALVEAAQTGLPRLAEGKFPTALNEVLVGSRVAEELHLHTGDGVSGHVWIDRNSTWHEAVSFRVSGLLRETGTAWDQSLYSNLESAQKVFEIHQQDLRSIWKTNLLHYYLIYLRPDPTGHPGAGMSWLKSLINQRTVAQTVAVDEEVRRLEELTGTQQELGVFISLVIVFLGALSAATMMLTRFDSMGQQIAVLRALGYAKSELNVFLLWEAVLIAGFSCGLGALLDMAFFPWVRELLGRSLPPSDLVPMALWNSYPIWLMALLGSLLSILIPLWRLQKQNIHTSLRGIN